MSEITQPERPRPRWGRRLAVVFCLMLIVGGLCLVYPVYRVRYLVGVLTQKGFRVELRSLIDDDWPDWMEERLGNAYFRRATVSDQSAKCGDDDLKLIGELFSLTIDGFNKPAEYRLTLGESPVTDRGLAHLNGLKRFRTLAIHSDLISDKGVGYLTKSPNIVYLHLEGKQITDAGLAQLRGLKKISILSLKETQITDASVPMLMRFTTLRRLYLSDTRVTPAGVDKLKTVLPKLKIEGP